MAQLQLKVTIRIVYKLYNGRDRYNYLLLLQQLKQGGCWYYDGDGADNGVNQHEVDERGHSFITSRLREGERVRSV